MLGRLRERLTIADEPGRREQVAPLYLAVLDRLREYVQRLGLIDGDSTCSSVSWFANGWRYAAAVRSAGVVSRLKSSVSARIPCRGGGRSQPPPSATGRTLWRYFVRIVEVEETLVRTSTNRASKGTSASR